MRGENLQPYMTAITAVTIPDDAEVAHLVGVIRDRTADRASRLAARNRLVEGNLRLVVMLARSYQGLGLPLSEVIAEGNLGLLRAARKYDLRAGTKFSTYATYWVRAAIRQALSRQGRAVRLPDYMHWLVRRYEAARSRLGDARGRPPTREEIRDDLGLDADEARHLDEALQLAAACRPGRGDAEARDRSPSPDEAAARRDAKDRVMGFLRRLPRRHARILRRRIGDGATLTEIGLEMGLTRERVRQLADEGLEMARAAATGGSVFAAAREVRVGRKKGFAAPAIDTGDQS